MKRSFAAFIFVISLSAVALAASGKQPAPPGSFQGAPPQYTRFSINHGNANGVCATCHTNSNDYAIFQCTRCHGGDNANNFNHPQVNGYVYNSVNCYQCHTGG